MSTVLEVADEAEVAVIGAGPAGASCAALLAEQGHDVLLIDKCSFPRDKPCGDGVTRSAVEFLQRLGLDDLIAASQPITGMRIVVDHRSTEYRDYVPTRRRPQLSRCIPRSVLDDALVNAAIARGARFLEARVVDRAGPGSTGVQALIGAERQLLRARYVVAADGATSRLRRTSGRPRRDDHFAVYAVRAYFRCERPVEPVFDIYAPLELNGTTALGYGWVFPIESHLVNVGVGYWSGRDLSSPTKIREVLAAFVEQLGHRARSRYGDLVQVSKLKGSPLGVHFDRDSCEIDGIVFVGDAARTTDPWSGEGIAYAIRGAEQIAALIHARTRQRGRGPDAGMVLARQFGRLGDDMSLPLRLAQRGLNGPRRSVDTKSAHPFLLTLGNVVADPDHESSLLGTRSGELLGRDPEMRARLETVHQILLEELETDFPLAAELLHRQIRSGLGPVAAVTAIIVGGRARRRDELLAAASAIELARASAGLIRQLVDHPRGDPARLNNGLCVLIADFAVSRSAHQAVRAGIAFTRELSATMKKTLVAQFGECQQAFTPNRTVENYLGMARARTSGPLALAARFATSLDGAGTDLARRVDGFCRALGVAVQISTDLEDLLANNHHSSRRSTGTDLRLGVHALPVIYAAKRDRRLRRLLCHPVEERDMPRIIQTLYDTGGMAKTLELATESTDNALAVLRGRGGTSVDGLEALAALTAEHTHAMIG